eukprot:scaffold33504_cov44-Phaeocystis_antarctica.AAC.1
MYVSVPIGSCRSWHPVVTLKPLWESPGTELSAHRGPHVRKRTPVEDGVGRPRQVTQHVQCINTAVYEDRSTLTGVRWVDLPATQRRARAAVLDPEARGAQQPLLQQRRRRSGTHAHRNSPAALGLRDAAAVRPSRDAAIALRRRDRRHQPAQQPGERSGGGAGATRARRARPPPLPGPVGPQTRASCRSRLVVRERVSATAALPAPSMPPRARTPD